MGFGRILLTMIQADFREERDDERERVFADVGKSGFFAWEYKGKKKNLDSAYQQLLRYGQWLTTLRQPPIPSFAEAFRFWLKLGLSASRA